MLGLLAREVRVNGTTAGRSYPGRRATSTAATSARPSSRRGGCRWDHMLLASAPFRELEIELSHDAGSVLMTLRGELDITGLETFDAGVDSLGARPSTVVLD